MGMGAQAVMEGKGKGVNENEVARCTQICMHHTWCCVHEGKGKQMKQCDAHKCVHVTLSHPHIWH